MTTGALDQELIQVGHKLGHWEAEIRGAIWSAVVLAVLWLASLSDIFLQLGTVGRFSVWGILVGVLGVGLWHISKVIAKARTPEGVAARIEHAFPQLDNHLINYVQFARYRSGNGLEAFYLRRGLPEWNGINLEMMKDKQRHLRAWLIFAGACVFVLAPFLWSGSAWGNALMRVLNPFSARPPSTLATILSVEPGDHTAIKGTELTLAVKSQGKSGQPVWLDVWPADDKETSFKLGKLAGQGAETFEYHFPKVITPMKYRFRVGDARSDRFEIQVSPPLSFTKISVTVTPPPYTKLKGRTFDGLAEEASIPQGSIVALTVQCNRALASANVRLMGQSATELASKDKGLTWSSALSVAAAKQFKVTAVGSSGEELAADLKFQLLADRAPVVRIVAPTQRTLLANGTEPKIQFEVSDDYGLTKIAVERVSLEERGKDAPSEVVQEWPKQGERVMASMWSGKGVDFSSGKPVAFRVVAYDNRDGEGPQRGQSALVIFDTASPKTVSETQAKAASATAATLAKLVELQTENLDKSLKADAVLKTTTAEQWKPLTDTQTEIRRLAGVLVTNPSKPLGVLQDPVRQIYQTTMAQAIDVLSRVAKADETQKTALSHQAIAHETTILRVLTQTKEAINRVEQHKSVTGVLAMLDALVAGQEETVVATKAANAKSASVSALSKKQDKLASDCNEFIQICRKESQALGQTDAAFAKLILQVADACEQKKISADMLRASEQLDGNKGADALPFEDKALAALKELQELLNQWRVQEAKHDMDELKKVVNEAKDKFDKLVKLQAKVVESLRAADQQKDLSNEKRKELEEEIKEVKENEKEVALKVATDLHIFPELPVINDLVDDVFQTFEEVKQVPGSESAPATELGLQKEDFMLQMMEDIKERVDDMEEWLTAKPDNVKRLTENFDKTEMPPMAVISNPTEMEDLIGELMKQEQDIKDQNDDSATNQAVPDIPMGWDTAEGEWVDYSAKGKSANDTPNHKEQDGRSLVGRQGMSDGETAAGSGKINEGDDKIEKRRTQDSPQSGEVKEEGHAKAVATGGGKQSGFANDSGMAGEGPRRDSKMPGSELGMQAMLRRNAEALFAKASMLHIRTGSLDEAVHQMHQAEEALAKGAPIQQVREYQRRAIETLKRTQAELNGAVGSASLTATGPTGATNDEMAGVPEEAPANYRDQVAEYFKSLGAAP